MLELLATFTLGFVASLLAAADLGGSRRIETLPYIDVGKNAVLDGTSEKDEKNNESPCKTYTISLKAFTTYVIEMKALHKDKDKSTFRPYLRVERIPSGEKTKSDFGFPVSDDNMHWNPDSETHLVFTCLESGDYKIIATMRRSAGAKADGTPRDEGDAGGWGRMAFLLSVRPLESQTDAAKMKAATLTWNDKFEAVLPMKVDSVRGTPAKEYLVDFKEGHVYDIEMRAASRIFSPYLRLENPDGRQVKSASDRDVAGDGFADEYTARMTYYSRLTGKFKIIATNYSGNLGKYDLILRAHAPQVRSLEKDSRADICDQLTKSDPRDTVLRFSPSKSYLFRFKAGFTYGIELRTLKLSGNYLRPTTAPPGTAWEMVAGPKSLSFDAVLRLEDDGGRELVFNDDEDAGVLRRSSTDSRITFACERDLTYRIVASSLDAYYDNIAASPHAGTGVFGLSVTKKTTARAFKNGKFSVTDRLTGAERMDRSTIESPAKVYALPFEAGKTYDIRLESSATTDFKGFLLLEDSNRRRLDSNYDITFRNPNARIEFRCDRTGAYYIGVANLLNRPADFSLTVEARKP